MPEQLNLTTPETFPSITSWRVIAFSADIKAPAIKIIFEANTGEQRIYRLVPNQDESNITMIRNGLSYINQGKFMTQQNKSLQRWLIEQAQSRGFLPSGIITGVIE